MDAIFWTFWVRTHPTVCIDNCKDEGTCNEAFAIKGGARWLCVKEWSWRLRFLLSESGSMVCLSTVYYSHTPLLIFLAGHKVVQLKVIFTRWR
uniref:Uncharacterized protein n=1 Tax=Physcomitrium patens TaxID=3218 RepID=A0A2K1J2S4_PHYPA|nr:hypothetical protein PHYPA_021671 [Physcomitrium patens]